MPIPNILKAFGFDEKGVTVKNFGSGLINDTWIVENGSSKYILQRINHHVFKTPETIASNIDNIGNTQSIFVMGEIKHSTALVF